MHRLKHTFRTRGSVMIRAAWVPAVENVTCAPGERSRPRSVTASRLFVLSRSGRG